MPKDNHSENFNPWITLPLYICVNIERNKIRHLKYVHVSDQKIRLTIMILPNVKFERSANCRVLSATCIAAVSQEVTMSAASVCHVLLCCRHYLIARHRRGARRERQPRHTFTILSSPAFLLALSFGSSSFYRIQ